MLGAQLTQPPSLSETENNQRLLFYLILATGQYEVTADREVVWLLSAPTVQLSIAYRRL